MDCLLFDNRMQNKIYIVLFHVLICGYEIVNAFIGHNIRSAQENEFPSVACIARYDPSRSWQAKMQCTGTLISHNFILTAAHCFDNANTERYEIAIGTHLIQEGHRYYPVWWISYDQWSAVNVQNYVVSRVLDDILLVKIFGVWQDVQPLQLTPVDPPSLMYGIDAYMIGCGKGDNELFPQHLQVASVRVIDLEVCTEVLSQLEARTVRMPDKYSCSIGVPYTQMYHGDSGGPLIYFGVVIGINIACSPRMNDTFHRSKVNIHINIARYQNFLNALIVPGY